MSQRGLFCGKRFATTTSLDWWLSVGIAQSLVGACWGFVGVFCCSKEDADMVWGGRGEEGCGVF